MKHTYHFSLALLVLLCSMLTSCSAIYLPIAKIEKYYHATTHAEIVSSVSPDWIYIGKLKIVPSDYSWSIDYQRAMVSLLEEAAKYGANYVYVKGLSVTATDFQNVRCDLAWGDGVTIEAELYRK